MSLLRFPIRQARALTGAALLAPFLIAPVGPAAGQDTTVIGSGRSGSGVTVNMGALDQGTAPSRSPDAGRGASGRIQLQRPGGGDGQGARQGQNVESGEPGPGPTGRVLRFPPLDEPKSRLTVDPEALATRDQDRSAKREQVARPQLRKPEPGGPSATPRAERGARDGTGTPRETRDSRLTSQGREMAGDAGQPAPDTDTGQARAGSAGAPDTPELPTAPSTQARRDTGAAGADTSGAATTGGQSGLDSPDPVTPETKPSREARGTGDGTRTAGNGTAAPDDKAGTAAPARDAPEGDAPAQTASAETGDGTGESAAAPADGEKGGTSGAGADDADAGSAAETQTAKRTPGDAALPGKLQLDFAPGSAELSASARDQLATLAERLADTPNQRIQLMAFAKGGDEGASRARRLSLSRALAVRSFLIDNGIRSTRMDVRALGDTAKAGPLDRVDIVPANR